MEQEYQPGISITRTTSGFPLSIGTALAMETLFKLQYAPYDPERKAPEAVNPNSYDTCYISLNTLFRNLMSAIDKTMMLSVTLEDYVSTLIEEMGVIEGLFQSEAPNCLVKFYLAEHGDLHRGVKFGTYVALKLYEPKTENQKHYHDLEEKVMARIQKYTDSIVVFKDAPRGTHDKALIVTSQPYDLIDFRSFKELDLLESYTGLVKPRFKWNSKYHALTGKDMSHLPFNKKLLFVFGDGREIKSSPSSLRQHVYDISVEKNWTPATGMEKINLDIQVRTLDPAIVAVLRTYS